MAASPVRSRMPGSCSGLLVGAAAWFLAQQVSSVLVAPSCSGGHRITIALVNLGLLAVCVIGGWPSLRAWREARHHAPVAERRRFLGILGCFATLLFAMAILSQGIADLYFSGCER